MIISIFFFNDTATTEIYTLSLHDALPISPEGEEINADRGIVVGTIRMGFGHYRMSMALASAANSMGYTPYWLDLLSFEGTAAARIIHDLDWLYSMASRVSQQFTLFNKLFWEKATSDMAKKLSYYVRDLKMTELFANICQSLPKHIPFVSSHPWAAQAALHADIKNVITMIPDNWPMAFHLAEGSIHTVQTPSAYLGYRTLHNMGMKKDEIDVSVHGDTLIIKGEKKQEKEIKESDFVRTERYYGSFNRAIRLPSEVQADKVNAAYKNGVLELVLPKKEESKPKQLKIDIK